MTNLIDGKKVPIYGTGDNIRDWLHVMDHCSAIDTVVRTGTIGELYCVGGNAERTNMQITQIILDAFDMGEEMIAYVADRKGHDKRYAINNTKITTELGWAPTVTFEKVLLTRSSGIVTMSSGGATFSQEPIEKDNRMAKIYVLGPEYSYSYNLAVATSAPEDVVCG